ncbi:putative chromatin modification-related protein eaf7 protein [Botryosphaeria dothidea]|uniref:Putative chromatin modification-related protein eaf7 protein n=1 Tax=Botryosphaeria dothidea TaxID=55169 RepID=A0A8H4N172_9PEZI|nr:putative chromatin modification-related protein eaf7 protein [Botryosphaeria dothidea]KAF4305140.1 putative chromatin modification-related protein eaf7 protein [Botryosphaeria dothidea]
MIANHHMVSKYVQDLEFNIHQLLWFFDFDHFLQELELQPNRPWLPPASLKHRPTQSFTPADLHQIYTHYTSERDTSIYYLFHLLSHPHPNPLHQIYTQLPHALAQLPNLRSITITSSTPHQQPDPSHHTWRNLTFAPPEPEPPASHQSSHISILLHALGRAAALLHSRGAALPLRALAFSTSDDSLFGGKALEALWGVDAPPSDARDDAFYEQQYRLVARPVARLTRLDVRVDCSASLRGVVGPLAAFLRRAAELRELALVVRSETGSGWRSRVAPDAAAWREKDVLLALLEGEDEEGWDGDGAGRGDGGQEQRGVRWPFLRKLSLGVPTTEEGLLGLLGRVAGTLRSLQLRSVRFLPLLGDWESALNGMRDILDLKELEMCWLQQDTTFVKNHCGEILVPDLFDVSHAEGENAEEWLQTTYQHYETQLVDFVLRKSNHGLVLDQEEFFRVHPQDCEWCTGRLRHSSS